MQTNSTRNYLQKLFSFVLPAAIACGSFVAAAAQDTVSNARNPPLTASMVSSLINLFEWSLGIEFSATDCADLQHIVMNYWETNDSKSIQSVRDTLASEQKMQAWSDAQRREVQPQIKERLLENFAQNQSDEMNDLLLAVYRRGQHNGPAGTATDLDIPVGLHYRRRERCRPTLIGRRRRHLAALKYFSM